LKIGIWSNLDYLLGGMGTGGSVCAPFP